MQQTTANAAQVLEQARSGDGEALQGLLNDHYDMIYRSAYKWCGNQTDAEDVAQEVCIKIAKSLPAFRGESRISSWVYRIVVNTAHDMQRKRYPHPADQPDIEPADHDSLHQTGNPATPHEEAERAQLWRLVRRLPLKQRDAVLLVYGEECSHGEAASVMNCAEATVSWHLHQARATLRRQLQEESRAHG